MKRRAALLAMTAPLTARAAQPLSAADPGILIHDGRYYLYATDDRDPSRGIPVWQSDDLLTWKAIGLALKRGDAFGTRDFWNGGVAKRADGKFLMHYTANEQLAFAVADSPLGPFRSADAKPLRTEHKELDTDLFVDGDGQAYFYFVRHDRGNVMHGARLRADWSGVDEASSRELLRVTALWEHTDKKSTWPVLEAPCMVKHAGRYHLVYTANDFRNPDYAVGIASSDSPLGPFTKHPRNPVLQRIAGLRGTGSAQLFQDLKGRWQLLCHAHFSDTAWSPRKPVLIEVTWTDDLFLAPRGEPRVLVA